jgi:hypothetical protein
MTPSSKILTVGRSRGRAWFASLRIDLLHALRGSACIADDAESSSPVSRSRRPGAAQASAASWAAVIQPRASAECATGPSRHCRCWARTTCETSPIADRAAFRTETGCGRARSACCGVGRIRRDPRLRRFRCWPECPSDAVNRPRPRSESFCAAARVRRREVGAPVRADQPAPPAASRRRRIRSRTASRLPVRSGRSQKVEPAGDRMHVRVRKGRQQRLPFEPTIRSGIRSTARRRSRRRHR